MLSDPGAAGGKSETKKGHVIADMALNSGGTDGTRTRDPLRDRQVF